MESYHRTVNLSTSPAKRRLRGWKHIMGALTLTTFTKQTDIKQPTASVKKTLRPSEGGPCMGLGLPEEM